MHKLSELSEKGQQMFEYYSSTSIKTPGQRALLMQALQAYDAATQAAEIIHKEGLSVTSERSGLTRAHPLLKVQREATAEMLKIFKLLGLERLDFHPGGMAISEKYPEA